MTLNLCQVNIKLTSQVFEEKAHFLNYGIFIKIEILKLERWLSGLEDVLLFQRTKVQFLAPMSSGSKLPVTPAPGDPFLLQTWWSSALTCTHTYV